MFIACRSFSFKNERKFELLLKKERGFVIKKMRPDGACLFRAVCKWTTLRYHSRADMCMYLYCFPLLMLMDYSLRKALALTRELGRDTFFILRLINEHLCASSCYPQILRRQIPSCNINELRTPKYKSHASGMVADIQCIYIVSE